jgi:hypothetical protein
LSPYLANPYLAVRLVYQGCPRGRGDHVLGDGEQVPQISGLLLLDMEDDDAARPEVEVYPELLVLVVKGLKHLQLRHLAIQGREVDEQLIIFKAVVEAVQEVATVSFDTP